MDGTSILTNNELVMKAVVLANKPNSPTTTYSGNAPDVDGNSPIRASPPRNDRTPKTATLTNAEVPI